MKWVIILAVIISNNFFTYGQDKVISCDFSTFIEGENRALDGGAFKPSSNATGEYMRALVVYVQFSIDNAVVDDWDSGQLPDWAYDIFDSETASTYTAGTVSDYFKKMANEDFDFIANVHPNLITLTTHKSWSQANADVLSQLNNQIADFTIYDNWYFDDLNDQFIFSESNGDNYLDMLIIIYRSGVNSNFGLAGGVASLGATLTTHDGIIINGSSTNVLASGITTQRGANTTYPPTLSIHLAHEYGHYLFGGNHTYYGLMTGLHGYYGQSGAMNSWERKKLGYIGYLEATYNGIPKTLRDYVETDDVFRVTVPFNSPTSSEYYLIENHKKSSYWDYVIKGGAIQGSELPNYTIGKGIYIWKITNGNSYPPTITAVTADGNFNWQYVGDYYAGPGWYDDKPWAGYLPKTERTVVNRHAGKSDRDPYHIYWNAHWAHKWVDQDQFSNWSITRDVMGDEYDAYNIGYNQLLTPWSNPSTTKIVNGQEQPTNISLELVSQNPSTGDIQVKAYSSSLSGQSLAPSKPQFLKVTASSSNHPQLTWTANIEPDKSYYKIYKYITYEIG